MIRTGGKFVKATTGYDLTQLVIGSEGTLAIVTEAMLKIYPRPQHSATVLVPFASVDEIASAVPQIVRSGVNPLVLEYVDGGGLATLAANVGLDLGIGADVQAAAQAYLIVVIEQHLEQRLDEDVAALAELVGELGAIDVFVLPPHSGALLLEAREKAFWVVKALGANDIIDVVVPRASVPRVPAGGDRDRGRARVDRQRGRARRRRQHPPVGVPARRRGAPPGHARDHRGRRRDGRRDLGRARHRQGEEAVLPRARGSRTRSR